MADKRRLDTLLVDRGLVETRTKAQALVIAGRVFSGERRLEKPGQATPIDIELTVRRDEHEWVSRGGVKLAHGLSYFTIDATDRDCLDIGASTGGFTDVLLQSGARSVVAVDVGRGQLDWSLRNDHRLTVLEGTNARHLTTKEIAVPPTLVVCDASFIGLQTVLPASMALAAPGAQMIALIKPQFEVGKGRVGKGGVVRDLDLHREVCERIEAWLADDMGWSVGGLTESPLKGPKGNTEFLINAQKPVSP
jgi:23S rRNA (cytidine1920-2'-O)/16S rRNA (cytidine1409-2'-O)-methyltransferase